MKNGIQAVLAPEWAPLPDHHPYKHLERKSLGKRGTGRQYTFAKLEGFRLTQFRRIVFFDIDVLFIRDAWELQTVSSAFAVARVPKGKNKDMYFNSGVMVVQPSIVLYNAAVSMWRNGQHDLYFSDDDLTEQDVLIELCLRRKFCGDVHELDPCVFNHGVWLPEAAPSCEEKEVVARHNFYAWREEPLARDLVKSFMRGSCRPLPSWQMSSSCGWPERETPFRAQLQDRDRLRAALPQTYPAWYGLTSNPKEPDAGW